jgi:membrane-associated phospholipid phosphatase
MESENASKLEKKLASLNSSSPLRTPVVVISAAFVSVLIVLCLANGIIPGPEIIVLCFFVYAIHAARSRRFVNEWIPFVLVFLSYGSMNTLVGSLSKSVHVIQPANADLKLFGVIPTLVLQQFYRSPFLDYLSTFLYSLHFVIPVVFAFLLWKYFPKNYRGYVLAFTIGTYAALMTYLFYPVAPPWYGVNAIRVLNELDKDLGVPFYRSFFDFVGSNPFAAFPSLHAMYPWLISLYALKIGKVKALPVLIFPTGVWFSVIYLGEHYVIDIIGAVIYGTLAFLAAEKLVPLIVQKRSRSLKTKESLKQFENLPS